MASKRAAEDVGGSSTPPPAKKQMLTQFEPVKIGNVSTLEELNIKVLQFQNKKLNERIKQKQNAEDELRKRIDQLEQRQTTDDQVLCIVNRFWNQLDEDIRVLLQRFDAEGADESEKKNESGAVTSFVTLLSQWDREEIEEKLHQRVEFSKRAIGKLLSAYDRLLQRNTRLRTAIRDKRVGDDYDEDEIDIKIEIEDIKIKKENLESEDKEKDESEEKDDITKADTDEKGDGAPEKVVVKAKREPKIELDEVVLEEVSNMQEENKRLHNLVTELHQKHHQIHTLNSEYLDKLTAAETENAELKNNYDEMEYLLETAKRRVEKYDRHLAEATQKLRSLEEGEVKCADGGQEGVAKSKYDETYKELEEQKELAVNRLGELEQLQRNHQDMLKQVEKLKMEISMLPEHVIVETTDYKCLQSQFSVMFNEQMQMKTQLEEARNLLQTSKNANLRHIEEMESAELEGQKKLRTDFIQLEDQLGQVRREYEMLRIEYEQTLAANEQTGPINREMRNLITSLKNHNEQLKGEVARYKRKLREAHADIAKLKSENEAGQAGVKVSVSEEEEGSGGASPLPGGAHTPSSAHGKGRADDEPFVLPRREEEEKEEREREKGKSESEIIKDLKVNLKKSQDSQKEMKLLLDMYKSVPKESRDKVTLMAAEKKARHEMEELRAHIRKLQESERKERRKLAEEDALRKIKRMDDMITDLQKSLTAQKQEEEALLSEMEVTGQAFEDMQEQNIRLIQQLKEKDDANFKLMSERIKSNQLHKLLREEKDVLAEQVATLHAQREAQNQVVRKLEEKERILQNNLATVEKELTLRQQGMEQHKRKALESAQTAADLKLHLDKYHAQLKDAQTLVTDKTAALQAETFKHKRMHEDVASMRRKLERARKIEMASSADEVLMEEIREYKEQLTCPSCKVKRKDAVLTKCFHVFCLDCLKTRYETRQRKCPKCNATFGANDFHRLYIS